jgi:hypothetical protein
MADPVVVVHVNSAICLGAESTAEVFRILGKLLIDFFDVELFAADCLDLHRDGVLSIMNMHPTLSFPLRTSRDEAVKPHKRESLISSVSQGE